MFNIKKLVQQDTEFAAMEAELKEIQRGYRRINRIQDFVEFNQVELDERLKLLGRQMNINVQDAE